MIRHRTTNLMPPAALRRLLCGALVLLKLGIPGPAAAQDGARFRDWTLLDLPAGGCVLHNRVLSVDGGLTLADVFLEDLGGDLLMSVRVPVGVSLADGMAYRHDGRPVAVPLIWQSCNTETCLAQVRATAREAERLRSARAVIVGFVPVPGARPLTFPVSLMGVTAGLAAQRACAAP
ncbi:invasion associated locus B family protein [Roseisalinus antarcticus]|uniref:Invasion associated locus B (IalB) protein n=1 Tax=Roseisalinus antarcticus TaxID=254357 RepID=A0A1Y5SDR8_9RHOB|nr:invasion associated locus B family protein [Roseisalinus antarcticus]SLN37349.1 Invasion associated locus B (IalB) protein [Roseisalinus antarcticus]